MRRLGVALATALVATALVGPSTPVSAAAVFTGAWTSIDPADGSTQFLLVSDEATPHVTLADYFASYCVNNGAPSAVFVGSATGSITGSRLTLITPQGACGPYEVDPGVLAGLSYEYQPATDTLLEPGGTVWRRLPSAAPGSRTIAVGPFVARWSATDPEAMTNLTWAGSADLTNSAPHPSCPAGGLNEFFGNAWGIGEEKAFGWPVGWGTSGVWSLYGSGGADILSFATGCYGTSGIPVQTRYRFLAGGPASARMQVERRFEFGTVPFGGDLRPYIPRLSLANDYSQVLYPSADGVLVSRDAMACGIGCPVLDWAGTWFALHDPQSGRGMVVRHERSAALVDLWIDVDGYSTSTSTAVLLRAPVGGFTGSLLERETLCLYDAAIWRPSIAPPAACTKPWTDAPADVGSKLGTAAASGTYGASTKVSPLGGYVTWQANLGLAGAGQAVAVQVSVRRPDGTWTPYSRLTSRRASSSGTVTFSWRRTTPTWVSLRFLGVGVATSASQARWR